MNAIKPNVKVDEFTIVSLPLCSSLDKWSEIAENEIYRLGEAMNFIEHLGPIISAPCALMGYTKGFDFGLHSFLARASYHEGRPASGVAIKLSAQALSHLCAVSGEDVRKFLSCAFELENPPHASRIDLAADFFDQGPTVQEICDGISNGEIALFREQQNGLRHISETTRTFSTNMSTQTLYVGKRAKNSRATIRIYDKKAEQISKRGPYLGIALGHGKWIRVELELHHEYADQTAKVIAECPDDASAYAAMAETLHSRCQCHRIDDDGKPIEELDWSKALCHAGAAQGLRPETAPCLDLLHSYAYHVTDSGLMTLLDKARGVWGKDGPVQVLAGILYEADCHEPGSKTLQWIAGHAEEARETHPDVYKFLEDVTPYVKARRKRG